MNNQWMKRTLLAISIQIVIGGAYAAETVPNAESSNVENDQATTDDAGSSYQATEAEVKASSASVEVKPVSEAKPASEDVKINKDETPSLVPQAGTKAAQALQQKAGDATQETNLQEVFTSNERQYSLIKKGEISTFYDLDYSYYRDIANYQIN